MWRWVLSFVGICSLIAPAEAQSLPAPKPTARDLYVGCYLMVHRTDVPKDNNGHPEVFSADWCGLAAIKAITYREGDRPEHKGYTFCLPKTAEMGTDPARAMAFAYMDWYESIVTGIEDKDGESAYVVSLIKKWPCN